MAKLALQDEPLSVRVEHNQLIIRVGVATLAFANIHDPTNPDDVLGQYRITNPRKFAQDVIYTMVYEDEDGSTPLTDFLDKMMRDAIGDGSMWVESISRT